MKASLETASQQKAYTLSDRATYTFNAERLDLEVMSEGDSRLFNLYSLIVTNPLKVEGTSYDAAMRLLAFMTSNAGRELIGSYRAPGSDQPLYFPIMTELAAVAP